MKLLINGLEKDIKSENIIDLLNELGLEKEKVVIEINKNIIERQNFENTLLNNKDNIEIVTLVGGG